MSDSLDRKISRTVHFMKLFSFVEIKYLALLCVDPNPSFHLSNELKYFVMGLLNVRLHMSCAVLGLQCELGSPCALHSPDGLQVAIIHALSGTNVLCLGKNRVSHSTEAWPSDTCLNYSDQ